MEVDDYIKLTLENFNFANPGAFYGAVAERSLGAGLIYADVVFPLSLMKRQAPSIQCKD